MSPRLALLALLTLPLAACEGTGLPGFGSTQEPQVEGHKGPPSVSPLEQPIEIAEAPATPVATAEAKTSSTNAFSAHGNEPFWTVNVAGGTAIYITPGNSKGRAIRVNRLVFDKGVEYVGVLSGRPFVVNIRGTACQDDMSGEKFPFTATLTVSGRSHRGCAGPASPEVAAAVAAIKAPAPAAPRKSTPAAPKKPAATRPAAKATPETATQASEAPVVETDTPTPASSPDTGATASQPAPAAPVTPAETPTAPEPETAAPEASETQSAPVIPAPAMSLPSTPPTVTDEAAGDSAAESDTE
ncbi:COG3650 family protein [Paracoccus seriniphilus]|uniref:Uncharacterized protein n=1 Tax=Paracoccus seriniphilus TaxID=184748 RepID=A0A239PPU9_9RHOB|nr:hypothetical protein [Paracoccus seriniphilus]WCR14829.1 hypothetical protein JHW44_05150 [Paracoccus seriniphilus]SNT71757.1 hypothetical protein SAMN05444959_102273 [Paracoccus seriniphilus]